MAPTRDTHRTLGRTPQGAASGSVFAGGHALSSGRDARVPALSLNDHHATAALAARITTRRGPTPSASPELLVAERSA